MYEMYPDSWIGSEERRQITNATEKPRRRARKEHSVNPPVIDRAEAQFALRAQPR